MMNILITLNEKGTVTVKYPEETSIVVAIGIVECGKQLLTDKWIQDGKQETKFVEETV